MEVIFEGTDSMNKPIFSSDQHRAFYEKSMARVREDSYQKAFFYLIGVSCDTRRMVNRLFDFEEDCIRPEALHEGWQTSGSHRLWLLAFNLWNGYIEPGHEAETTPDNLFACDYAPYMLEGIRLRYPEYCREIASPQISAPKQEPGHER